MNSPERQNPEQSYLFATVQLHVETPRLLSPSAAVALKGKIRANSLVLIAKRGGAPIPSHPETEPFLGQPVRLRFPSNLLMNP
jgi:hypothetical protein